MEQNLGKFDVRPKVELKEILSVQGCWSLIDCKLRALEKYYFTKHGVGFWSLGQDMVTGAWKLLLGRDRHIHGVLSPQQMLAKTAK